MTRRMTTILPAVVLAIMTSAAAIADTPPVGASSITSQEFTALIDEALQHAKKADSAGSQGDGQALKNHAWKALDKVKQAQRAGHNQPLNDSAYALGDAIEHAGGDAKDATEHVKRAIMKLSQSAGLQVPEGVPTGEGNAARGGSSGMAGAYSGGFFDDGFFDDDWFYDYYESSQQTGGRQHASPGQQYKAEQLYEDAQTSGLFDS